MLHFYCVLNSFKNRGHIESYLYKSFKNREQIESYLYKHVEEFKRISREFFFFYLRRHIWIYFVNIRNIWSNNQSQCSLDRAMHSSLIWWELMNTHVRRCIPEQLMLKLMQFVFNYARSFRPVACHSIVLIEITSNPRIGQRGWTIVYTDLIDRRFFQLTVT